MKAWKPGHGWRTAIRNTSWWRHNHDGTITAKVVLTTWPDGEIDEHTVPSHELWTVRLPLNPNDPLRAPAWMPDWIGRSRLMPWRYRNGWLQPGPVYMLNDKPHRVTWWDEDHSERKVLNRQPLPAALVAAIRAEGQRHGYDPLEGYEP